MGTTVKFARSSNGIKKVNSLINKHVMSLHDSKDAIWIGVKRYAH